MKKNLTALCLILYVQASFGQDTKMEILNNKLLCNVFTYGKADSTTNQFLKKHFPHLTGKKPVGIVFTPPRLAGAKNGTLPMKFLKHPFFDFNIVSGQVNFQTIKNPGEPAFEVGADLYLFFANFQSADSAFNHLSELYKQVTTKQNISIHKDYKTGKFINTQAENNVSTAIIKLSKNGTKGYKIYFNYD